MTFIKGERRIGWGKLREKILGYSLTGKWVPNLQRLDDKSRMSRDVHVRICESVRVKSPRATRPLVSQSLKNLLEKEEFETFVAPIGLAALDLGAHEIFDLVIADIRMPGMNGIEALKALRELQERFEKPHVPEIILTAFDIKEIKEEASKMGVAEFMMKPFDREELLSVIRRHLTVREESSDIKP